MDTSSKSGIRFSFIFGLLLCLIFLFPYLALWPKSIQWAQLDFFEILWALKNSCVQAFGTACGCLLIGFISSRGLLCVPRSLRPALEILLLLPSLVPTLVILMIFLDWIDPFPIGIVGVWLVQIYIYSGAATYAISKWADHQTLKWGPMAALYGQNFFSFMGTILRSSPKAILQIFFLIFVAAWTSLSVPLAIGGGMGTNLEVLIFEKSRLAYDSGSTWMISLVQFFFLILFGFLHPKQEIEVDVSLRSTKLFIYPARWAQVPLWAYALSLPMGLWVPLARTWSRFFELQQSFQQWIELSFATFVSSIAVGIMCAVLLCVTLWASLHGRWRRILFLWIPSSTALLGTSLWICSNGNFPMVFFVFGFAALSLPNLLRYGFEDRLQAMEHLFKICRLSSESEFLAFRTVIWPELRSQIFLVSGVAALWASGDFALARFVFLKDSTLAMVAQTLMAGYRIELGFAVMLLNLLVGSFAFLFFATLSLWFQKGDSRVAN